MLEIKKLKKKFGNNEILKGIDLKHQENDENIENEFKIDIATKDCSLFLAKKILLKIAIHHKFGLPGSYVGKISNDNLMTKILCSVILFSLSVAFGTIQISL